MKMMERTTRTRSAIAAMIITFMEIPWPFFLIEIHLFISVILSPLMREVVFKCCGNYILIDKCLLTANIEGDG